MLASRSIRAVCHPAFYPHTLSMQTGGRRFLMNLRRQPLPPSSAAATSLSSAEPIEEERTPNYNLDRFYPAYLGQILHQRYQIATKVGYGSDSTVWLARDLHRWRWERERYVVIKINAVRHHSRGDIAKAEADILQHISNTKEVQHPGSRFVRKLIESFSLDIVTASHTCLVFEPLREPLWLYCKRYVGNVIPPEILKVQVMMMLEGLDYLHSYCKVIHTAIDLKPDNIMVKVEDPSILERDAKDEYNNPLPQKLIEGRTIYLSRNNYGPLLSPAGTVQITDFGLSVMGDGPHFGCIQAEIYRAPEVILDAGYTYAADIWSLGVMLWDLLEGTALFAEVHSSASDEYNESLHLEYLTALLGPPPEKLLARGRRTSMFYGSDSLLMKPNMATKDLTFTSSIDKMSGEEKVSFIAFIKRLLRWLPEERGTAKELLDDPWLHTDFPQE